MRNKGIELPMPPKSEAIPTAIDRLKAPSAETDLLRTAVGSFDVRSRLWPAEGAEPIVTDAIARRRMVDDLYLEEIMEPKPELLSRSVASATWTSTP